MKLPLWVLGVLLACVGSASAQSSLSVVQGISAHNGRPAINNVPFVNNGLYLIRLQCSPYKLNESSRSNYYYPPNPFVDATRQLAFTVTLSNARIGTNEVPPTSSVLAAVPVVADTLSRAAPISTKNGACNQSFLVTGRTPLYLTALYTDQISDKPSELVSAIEAFASLVAPLAGFFTGGVANLLKGDTQVATSMATPYANLVGTLNYSSSQTDTEPLQQGYYLVKTPVGTVAISVDKLPSLQSALQISEIAAALDTSWQSLGSQIQSKIGSDAAVCFEVGKTLELNQNLIHSDAVHALALIVNYSSITSNQATNCLGTYFGPEVAEELKTINPGLHLGPGFPDLQNIVLFSQVQLTFAQVAGAMTGYATGKDTKSVLDNWFEPQVSVTDTAPQIFDSGTSSSIEQILDKMKSAPAQYVAYGCQEKDTTMDSNGVQDTGFFLAIGRDGKPDDVLILRTWWRFQGSNRPRIYQMYLGYDATISQALNDYKNVCAYHITVGTPVPAAVGSPSAKPTPATTAVKPVAVFK